MVIRVLVLLQLALLEQESAALKDEDRQLTRLLADMAAQRDRCAAGFCRTAYSQLQSASEVFT
jgi:hypothetical protein